MLAAVLMWLPKHARKPLTDTGRTCIGLCTRTYPPYAAPTDGRALHVMFVHARKTDNNNIAIEL